MKATNIRSLTTNIQSLVTLLCALFAAFTSGAGFIGNTNDGTQTDGLWFNGDFVNASRFQASSNMTVATVRARVTTITGKYKCAIYSGSSSLPSGLLRTTTEVTNPGTGWQTFTLTAPQSLTNGSYYWLAIWSDADNAQVYYSDTLGTLRWQQTNYAASWPNPIVTTDGSTLKYCIYAESVSAALAVTTTSLPNGVTNLPYSATLTATGGTTPYTWSLASGSLPTGLTLNTNSGVIGGTPTATGNFSFRTRVRDNTSLMATSAVLNVSIAALNPLAATETFDSYANGTVITNIGGGSVWSSGANTVVSGGGVNGTAGLSNASPIFNWKGQPFQWSTLAVGTKVAMSLDFQSSPTGTFDDDRVGWTITPDASTSTGSQLALQLDNTTEGGMVFYHNATRTPVLNPLTGIKNSTWYRFNVEFTKLTATSAGIVGTLTELTAAGNPTGTPYVGTIADTSAFANPPSTALFTAAQQCPSFKNHNAALGQADNATFTITPAGPQPLTVAITSPANNATVTPNFTLNATATGGTGTITNVSFYAGNTLLGNDNTSPYSYTWNPAALGSQALQAVAQDNTGLAATSAVVNVTVTAPSTATFTETFNSYPNGTVITNIGGGGVWTSGTNLVLSTGGVNGSGGLSPGHWIFNWKAHTFEWSALADGTKLAMSLDFQSSTNGKFDDDRVGWTITPDANTSTGSQLALQLDNTTEGGMVFYHNLTRTPVLNPLTGIKNSTWYRFHVEFTKLGATNAAIVGTLTELDASGTPTGTPYLGTIPDTSLFANPPSNTLFTATQMCPTFKNHIAAVGNADNAAFTITSPTAPAAAQYVIVISVDGMGSAYVTPLLTPGLPNELTTFKRFQTEGAGTLNARTDAGYAITLPNHTCMMTCRGVSGASGHNWTDNGDPAPGDTIALNKGSYVASGFDVAHDNGLRTGIWAGKSKFSLFQQSYGTNSGALDITGPDNGRDKIDYDKVGNLSAATLTDDLTNQMSANPFHFVFFHFHEPDTAGHASGWSTDPASPYAAALKAVDTQIGKIIQMVENSPTLQGKTAIILTTDHGGHGTTHGDMSNPLDYTIPFYVWGPGVTAGGDLYSLNPSSRTSPGTANVPYTGGQPVRNGDAANLALNFLDLPPVPGSTINSAQDLRVNADTTTPSVTLSLTGSPMAEAAGVATVTATLSETSASIVTVNLAFAGTATLATDYTRSGTSISIPAGSLTGSITLTAVQDSVYENPAETIVVDISTVVNATESGNQQVTATITDDDPVPPVITLLNQNFDSMGSAGTTLPAAWTAGYLGTVSTQNRLVMSPYAGNGLGITAMPVVVSDGSALPSPDVGTVFNLGAAGNSDRALGSYARTTPSGDHIMQVAIVNTSGSPLTTINVSYVGEQWRQSQGTSTSGPEMLRFLASTTSPTTGFTSFPSLDFTAPMQTTADAPVGGLNGNLAANRAVITGTITFASPVPAGGTFYLRWHDWNDNGTSDHFLAIDDVIVSTDAPTLPTVTLSLTGSLMAEAADGATVTATLSETSASVVTVNLAFSGTATLTSDYTRSGASITIPAGSLSGSITLTAVQDTVYENPDETIVVDIDTVVNATESGIQQVFATITDDDPAPLVSIAVTPANPTIILGNSQQFTATGTYADSSTQNLTSLVIWSSSNTAIATINSSGLATGVTASTTTVSATLGGVSGDTLLTVQPKPITVTANSGQSKVFGAADPTLTYVSSDPVATFTGALSRAAGTNVGNYAIIQDTLSAGTNFSITFVSADFAITPASSSAAIGSSLNPSTAGSNVTFTVTVSPVSPATTTPTGNVQFLTNDVAMGSPVSLVDGIATLDTALLPPGTNTITASYLGGGNYLGSSNSLLQVVNVIAETPSVLGIVRNGDGSVTMTFAGTPGAEYHVLSSTNVALAGSWLNVSTNTAGPTGQWTYTDNTVTSYAQRFFRAAKP